MKFLSIVVPCYNSGGYMRRCINSLLAVREYIDYVEIVIVNDGSTDATGDIAEEYVRKYPRSVRVVHQENSGHGGAINSGLALATGIFVKIIDSDDWVDVGAFLRLLEALKGFEEGNSPDVVICNYVYEKVGKRFKFVINYKGILPEGRLFTWEETGRFRLGWYLLMHSLIYRRDILQQSGLRLPEHSFYVDNIYAYVPLVYVRTMYYLNVNLYRYYIGRPDQSVREEVMIGRIDQQLDVNRLMVEAVKPQEIQSDKQCAYLSHYMEIITAVSSILLLREGSRASLEKKTALWQFIKEKDVFIYKRLRTGIFGRLLHLPTSCIILSIYRIARRIVGFS